MFETVGTFLRCRIREAGLFQPNSFYMVDIDRDKGVFANIGTLTSNGGVAIQALRFDADKWDEKTAKTWCDDNKMFGDQPLVSMTPILPDIAQKYAAAKQLYAVEKDIFSVGTWNGEYYSEDDLDDMVKNFKALSEIDQAFRVPLKIDLFKDEVLKDKETRHGGMPSLGWITEIKRVGKKLYAHIEGIPKLVKDMIDTKRYHQVSAEVVWNLRIGKEKFRRALTGVALLGVELPGVRNLDEFGKLYTYENKDRESTNVVVYEEIKPFVQTKEKESNMPLTDAEVQALRDKAAEAEALKAENTQLKTHSQKLEQEKAASDQKAIELANSQRQIEVKAFIDKAEAEGKVLPTHRETIVAIFSQIDDTKVCKFKEGDKDVELPLRKAFESYILSMPKLVNFKEKAGAEGNADGLADFKEQPVEKAGNVLDQKLDHLTRKYMAANKVEDYGTAFIEVKKAHPELQPKAE